MGWEGANVIFDSWVHPLMMGLEEHLIGMFREDFEFSEGHMSHLHSASAQNYRSESTNETLGESGASEVGVKQVAIAEPVEVSNNISMIESDRSVTWSTDGEAELKKIPFFVRGKIKRNTEKFASDRGISSITVETLYEAKAQIGK
jgi:light-independent protochlorophyllide reductase subunit B